MCCFGISLLSQKKLASLLFSLWKHVLLGYRINNVYRFFTHLHSQQIGVIKLFLKLRVQELLFELDNYLRCVLWV